MSKFAIKCLNGKERVIDLFQLGEIAVFENNSVGYKSQYGGEPNLPNFWSVGTAIKDCDDSDLEWYLRVEGTGRIVKYVELGCGAGYDFDKKAYDVRNQDWFSGGEKKFRKSFVGFEKFLFSQMPKTFHHVLIKKLVRQSIPVIRDSSSAQIKMARDVKKWKKQEQRGER